MDALAAPVHAAPAAASSGGGVPEGLSRPWLEAQLKQRERHVLLLSDALLQRSELSVEIEAILLQLSQPPSSKAEGTPDPRGAPVRPVRGLTPEWAASAMRRIRAVQFAEELADNLRQQAVLTGQAGVRPSAGARSTARSMPRYPAGNASLKLPARRAAGS
jgi:hypothetical protein